MPSIAVYLHELVLERMAMVDGRHIWLTNTVKIDFVPSRPERQPLTRADLKTSFAKFVSHTMPPAANGFLESRVTSKVSDLSIILSVMTIT